MLCERWSKRFNGVYKLLTFILVSDKDLANDVFVKLDPTFAGRAEYLSYATHLVFMQSEVSL